MLSGKDSRSLWVQGAYGSGKSHAALTVKSLLEASDDEIRAYFRENDLSDDLCQKLITDKNGGKLITIHRIGSASIRSDDDLILAIQDSVTAALKEHGIQNRGEASLKDAALKWFNARPANRTWFNDLIHDDEYQWEFGRQTDRRDNLHAGNRRRRGRFKTHAEHSARRQGQRNNRAAHGYQRNVRVDKERYRKQ